MIILKKRLLSLCTILFFFSSVSFIFASDESDSFELHLVNQDNIEKNKTKIARTLRIHWWMRTGCVVGSVATCSYIVYQFLRSSQPDIKVSFNADSSSEMPFPERLSFLEKEVAMLKKTSAETQPIGWGGWFKNKASYVGNYVALSVAVAAVHGIYGRVFHDDTIKWFVRDKTCLNQLVKGTKLYAKKLTKKKEDGRELTSDKLNYYRETLAGICRQLVSDIELVAGYMEYSVERFQKCGANVKPDALLQAPHLVAITNDFIKSMQKLFPIKSPDSEESVFAKASLDRVKKLFDVAGQFASDLDRQIDSFSGIEWALKHN